MHRIDADKICCSAKRLKSKFGCYKNAQKSASKNFIKTFPTYFLRYF